MDAERIKSPLRRRWRQVLTEVGGFPPSILDGRHHPCPKCGGRDRFQFSDKDGDGSIICRKCGKGIGDGIEAIRWYTEENFRTVAGKLESYLSIGNGNGKHNPQKTARKESPAPSPFPSSSLKFDQLGMLPETQLPAFVNKWCLAKGGMTAEHALRARPKPGYWSKNAPKNFQLEVLAFPAFRPPNWTKPSAVLLYRTNGKSFPEYAKGGLRERKTHLLGGSVDSLLVVGTPDELQQARAVWLVAGLPDAIAISPHLPPGHVAVTSACGEGSFAEELVEAFSDKRVYIAMDADPVGQEGAQIRARALFGVVKAVYIVKLPVEGLEDSE